MTEAKWSLRDLQEQQREWLRANFSDPATGAERPSWMPLLGLAEELGELAEAKSDAELDDAMADIVIFGSDYCSAVGWDIQDLWENRKRLSESSGWSGTGPRIVVCVGRIAHHHLKRSQGIRGSAEHHDREGRRWFAALLEDVGFTIGGALRDERAEQAVFDLVRRTWEQVRQRNWRTKSERTVEAARRSLSSVAESMTEHAYQELASSLDAPPRVEGLPLPLPPDVAAQVAEADRLRKLFDAAGQGEHNVLALIDHYQRNSMEADERLRAVRELLAENGCECPCDHHLDERGPDCEVCLACRIGEVVDK